MALSQLVRRLRMLVGRSQGHRDLDDEIRLHVELLERQQCERGVTGAQARAAARRRFGNPLSVAEDARDALGFRWLDDFRQDARYGIRRLLKERRFAFSALTTLALGIGATTAIFSVVSGLVLRPLPFADPERLVMVRGTSPLATQDGLLNYAIYRQDSTSFEALAGYEVGARYMRDATGADRVMTVRTERDFFAILGVPPIRGRTFEASDPPTVAVISERFWRTRLDGQSSVLGTTLVLDGEPFTIVGVMPEWFQFPYGAASLLPGVASQARTDVWMLFSVPLRGRIGHVLGRLKTNVSVASAQSEMSVIAKRLETMSSRNAGRGVRVMPLGEAVVSPPIRRVLFLLFGAVGLVLALACANVANLFLARMASRSREVAIRSALGARRTRLVRQLLTESLVLSLAGGAIGLAIAWWGTRRLMLLAAAHIPRATDIAMDWRVFVFLFATCAVAGAVMGIAPAVLAARKDARAALQESVTQSTTSRGQRWMRDGLVVMEVAAALVLAIAAAMLVRELIRLRQTDSGMQTRNVVTFHLGHRMVSRGEDRPYNEDVRPFLDIEDRVAQLPGVRAAGFTQLLPLQNWGWASSTRDFRVRGEEPQSVEYPIELRFVTPGYFRAQGIRIVKGRGFDRSDTRESPMAIVINETLARRYFGDRDPVGAETTRGTIIGVIGDVRQVHLDRSTEPEVYTTIAQNWSQLSDLGMTLVVSTHDRPEASIDAVRSIVREVNPNLAIFNIKTMDRVVAESLSGFTLYLSLIACFAALALVLAVSGTYGVISCVAMSRMREFAIRMALGADKSRVMRLVIAQGVALAIAGIVIGTLAAYFASPLLRNFPITVRPPSVLTVLPVALALGVIAVAASAIPARRASRTDPMAVLRNE